MRSVLVTGGAGYIGSVTARFLRDRGHRVVIVDDFSTGHREAIVPGCVVVEANVRDRDAISRAVRDHAVDAAIHFAARIQVGESVRNPRKYYRDNFVTTLEFVETLIDEGVKRLVFSSTAAVYGNPVRTPIDETHPTAPINSYGETKLAIERMLAHFERAYGLSWAALRYFNASGADPEHGLGELHDPETHLIPLALEAARTGSPLSVFGNDFETRDGTCVRDYVHVKDLAEAHARALESEFVGAMNVGIGAGHTVLEVLDAIERVAGKQAPRTIGPRREGDPPSLVADPAKMRATFGWVPERRLEEIVADAAAFEGART